MRLVLILLVLLSNCVFGQAPTIQSSNIATTAVKTNSVSITLTAGNGTGQLIVMKVGSPIDAFPLDGVSYNPTVNFNYGGGISLGNGNFVVADGGGSWTGWDITGLSPGTTYYLQAIQYNGTSYLTTSATGNPISFTTKPLPTITSFSPTSGAGGISATINGTDFSTTGFDNSVYFGAVKATVTNATATTLTILVPRGATYKPISLTLNGVTVFSQGAFTTTFPATGDIDANSMMSRVDFTSTPGPISLVTGDFDQDTKPDVAMLTINDGKVTVYKNSSPAGSISSSTFTVGASLSGPGGNPRHLAVGDLDGDGWLDLVIGNPSTISIFRNKSTVGAMQFETKVDLAGGPSVSSNGIVVADFDKDGKLDLATGRGSSIGIFRNISSPGSITTTSFAPKVDITANTLAVATGDIDGDGRTDLLSMSATNVVSILRNNINSPGSITSTSFEAPVNFDCIGSWSVCVGDLDGDGKPDLATGSQGSTSISVLRNKSVPGTITTNSFEAHVDFAVVSNNPREIAMGDMNGDGKPELAVVNTSGTTVVVLNNASTVGSITTASFEKKVDIIDIPNALDIDICDFDGDGKSDLAIGQNGTSPSLAIVRGLGPMPTLSSFAPASGGIGANVTITGANFSATPANNAVYFGATKATVTSATTTELIATVPAGATYQPISVTLTGLTATATKPFDVTFTGGPIIANSFGSGVTVGTGTSPQSIAIGDIDGDGKADVVTANSNNNSISVLRNAATLGAITGTSFETKDDFATDTSPVSVALGDLDGDGKKDVVTANLGTNTMSVFRNTSSPGAITSGSLAPKFSFTAGTAPRGVAIGDLDGDRKPDVAVVNATSNTLSIFRNVISGNTVNGGSFTSRTDFATGAAPYGVGIGDLDGDNKPEIAVVNSIDNTVSVFKNTSVAGSWTSTSLAAKVDFATGTNPYAIALRDLDQDGRIDMVVSNYGNSSISVFKNTTGVGPITFSKIDFSTGANPYGIVIGELNGDGKPDIGVASTTTNSIMVLENATTAGTIVAGSFLAGVNFTTGTGPYAVAFGDLDNDGRTDIASVNFNESSLSVFKSNIVSPEPASQPSGVVFSNVQSTSLGVSYTAAPGNPAGYLVLRKTGSLPTDIPPDGVAYIAGASIGSSTVAYSGADVTFNDSNLSAATQYFYVVFAYNGSGITTNYLANTPPQGNKTTLATEPGAQPGALTFTNTQTTSLTVNYVAAAGNPSGYIALRRTLSSPTDLPSDGVEHSKNATLGTSVVAYSGSALNFDETGLTPSTGYFYDIFSYNGSGETINYLTSINPSEGSKTTAAVVTDTSPPTVAHNALSSAPVNANLTISAEITDNESTVTAAVIQWRAISSTSATFNDASMAHGSGNTWSGQIPASAMIDLGVEYKILVTNNSQLNNSASQVLYRTGVMFTNSGIPISYSSFGDQQSNYRIISIPLNLTAKTVNEVFDEFGPLDDETTWRIFRYDNSKNPALFPLTGSSQLKPGEGYWLISNKPVSAINTGPGESVAITGSSLELITLNQGWNQVGNPFNFDISWTDIRDANPSINLQLGLKARSWDGTQPVEVDEIKKTEGAYISFTGTAGTKLAIPTTKNALFNGRVRAPSRENSSIDSPEWEVDLMLTNGILVNETGGIGMSVAAREDVDQFDDFNFPRFLDYLEVKHPRRFVDMTFTKDVVTKRDQYTWNFDVESSLPGPATLYWDNSYFGNNDKQLFLFDIESGRVYDMRQIDRLVLDLHGSRKIRISYGDLTYARENTLPARPVIFVSPNPFKDDLLVEVAFPESGLISMDVLDVGGRAVKQLVRSHMEKGSYQFPWNGLDDQRQAISPGVYILRLQTPGAVEYMRVVKH